MNSQLESQIPTSPKDIGDSVRFSKDMEAQTELSQTNKKFAKSVGELEVFYYDMAKAQGSSKDDNEKYSFLSEGDDVDWDDSSDEDEAQS
ncbi:hypothetical protein K7X08_015030 [Anisodus acutangulus]|uniref:Uncharacterized protein n=1 Tax=Anisodus acutangulus TaxID=402998 RepID=A0A9Q1QT85_9SOLA|nr:hypothetical protein K7X08_015030 [Anisodus acutangulus]